MLKLSNKKKVMELYTRIRGCKGLGGDGQEDGESNVEKVHGDDA